ncbi:MAG: hypothetical protein KBA06_00165 [Saprospiraceae bacterium]|nr:hypothetical protein [Saprospiraceae bacterium]
MTNENYNNQQYTIPSNSNESDEITLRELILKIKEFTSEILNYWYVVLLFIIIGTSYMFYKVSKTTISYPASITFMVNDDKGGGAGIASVLGSFGFGGAASETNIDKILELSKSRKIIQNALFRKEDIGSKTDYLANHLINIYKLDKSLEGSTLTKMPAGFRFKSGDTHTFGRVENTALLMLYGKLIGGDKDNIYSSGFSKNSGIMNLNVRTENEELSLKLVSAIYEELSNFYVLKSVEKQKANYDLVKSKVDSLRAQLYGADYKLASFEDYNLALVPEVSKLTTKRLSRDIGVLSAAYGEALKNLEIADLTLKSKTPYIQPIDTPIFPLKPEKQSKSKALMMGFGIGLIASSLLIIFRKIIKDAMLD